MKGRVCSQGACLKRSKRFLGHLQGAENNPPVSKHWPEREGMGIVDSGEETQFLCGLRLYAKEAFYQ